MAANVGGMASPIASPQNIIAVGSMSPPPTWPQWFLITIPLCITIDLLIWALLLFIYKPDEQPAPPELYNNQHIQERKLNSMQVYVIGVVFLTIFMWCIAGAVEGFFGDMGVIAIIPIVLFYGASVLTKDDWNSMLWSGIVSLTLSRHPSHGWNCIRESGGFFWSPEKLDGRFFIAHFGRFVFVLGTCASLWCYGDCDFLYLSHGNFLVHLGRCVNHSARCCSNWIAAA